MSISCVCWTCGFIYGGQDKVCAGPAVLFTVVKINWNNLKDNYIDEEWNLFKSISVWLSEQILSIMREVCKEKLLLCILFSLPSVLKSPGNGWSPRVSAGKLSFWKFTENPVFVELSGRRKYELGKGRRHCSGTSGSHSSFADSELLPSFPRHTQATANTRKRNMLCRRTYTIDLTAQLADSVTALSSSPAARELLCKRLQILVYCVPGLGPASELTPWGVGLTAWQWQLEWHNKHTDGRVSAQIQCTSEIPCRAAAPRRTFRPNGEPRLYISSGLRVSAFLWCDGAGLPRSRWPWVKFTFELQ